MEDQHKRFKSQIEQYKSGLEKLENESKEKESLIKKLFIEINSLNELNNHLSHAKEALMLRCKKHKIKLDDIKELLSSQEERYSNTVSRFKN